MDTIVADRYFSAQLKMVWPIRKRLIEFWRDEEIDRAGERW